MPGIVLNVTDAPADTQDREPDRGTGRDQKVLEKQAVPEKDTDRAPGM